jgi:thymidylate synthase
MHPLFTPEENYDFLNHSIKADSIASAYKQALTTILTHGIDFKDERGDKMKTLFNLMVTVKRPLEGLEELEEMHKRGLSPYSREFLDSYADQLINGPKESEYPFEYNYNERLRKRWSRLGKNEFQSLENDEVVDSEYLDQIDQAIKNLNKNPNSRRIVCVTWIPSVDTRKIDVPCLNYLVFYNISGKLHLSVAFRSHDVFGAYASNLYGISRLLEYVALRTGLKIGTLTVISVNAHYNRLFEEDVIRIIKYKRRC